MATKLVSALDDNYCVRFCPCLKDPAMQLLLHVAFLATTVATFIIFCLGAAGTFPNFSTFGSTVLGLSLGGFALAFLASAEDLRGNRDFLILTGVVVAIIATLGGLGMSGALTMRQIGTGSLITLFAGPLVIGTALYTLKRESL